MLSCRRCSPVQDKETATSSALYRREKSNLLFIRRSHYSEFRHKQTNIGKNIFLWYRH